MKLVSELYQRGDSLASADEFIDSRPRISVDVPLSNVVVRDDGYLDIDGVGQDLRITKFAASQLSKRLKIPTKILQFPPVLAAENFNSFLPSHGEHTRIHVLDDIVVGFTSPKLFVVDPRELVDALSAELPVSISQTSWWTDDRGLRFRFIADNLVVAPRKDDPIKLGIDVWYEENTDKGLGLAGSLYRLICTNGAVAPMGEGVSMSLARSRWKGTAAQIDALTHAFDDALSLAESATTNFSDMVDMEFEIPDSEDGGPNLEYLKPHMKFLGLPYSKYNVSLYEALEDEEPTVYGLYNAVTRMGRDAGTPSLRDKFERAGFKLLSNLETYKKVSETE